MIRFNHSGNFKRTEKLLRHATRQSPLEILKVYGQAGVDTLAAATPARSGATAAAWSYEIEQTPSGYSLYWTNSNENQGVNIALILQYGHGTGTGGYVRGIDYINPAIRPIFDQIANAAWKEVIAR